MSRKPWKRALAPPSLVVQWRRRGASATEIARALGVSDYYVYRILRQYAPETLSCVWRRALVRTRPERKAVPQEQHQVLPAHPNVVESSFIRSPNVAQLMAGSARVHAGLVY